MTIPKFRAWLKDEYRMTDVREITFFDDEVQMISDVTDFYTYGEFELMQSTGLVDENGKEIFNGDIVLIYGEKISKVFYSQGSFCVDILNGGTPLHGFSPKQLEVIGNVWENPELVEEEK